METARLHKRLAVLANIKYRDDSIELFFDTLHNGGNQLNGDDYKFYVNINNVQGDYFNGGAGSAWNTTLQSAARIHGTLTPGDVDEGYSLEIAIPWRDWVAPSSGNTWGFDVVLDDRNDAGARKWKAWSQQDSLNNPAMFGDMVFSDEMVPEQPVGLVASYNFDEGSGAILTDRSGNNNKGSIAGGAWTSSGKNGGALVFDGTDTMVTVNEAASLHLGSRLTMEAWVYPTALSISWPTVIFKETTGGLVYALYANSNTSQPSTYLRTFEGPGAEKGVAGGSKLPLNTWTHLASTYDGTNLRLYVNGTLVASQPFSGSVVDSNQPLFIGANRVWGDERFTGRLDDVRIYNRALSASEIKTDMSEDAGTGACSGWPWFEEASEESER